MLLGVFVRHAQGRPTLRGGEAWRWDGLTRGAGPALVLPAAGEATSMEGGLVARVLGKTEPGPELAHGARMVFAGGSTPAVE